MTEIIVEKGSLEEIVETAFHNDVIHTSINQLTKVFGKDEGLSGNFKTTHEWWIKLNGTVCSIYDWKYYRTIELDEIITWHIGAKNAEDSHKCLKLIKELIQNK